jgi:hypothetical protein
MSDFKQGWIIGDFLPSLWQTSEFEVGIKRFSRGETEPRHYQRKAVEITVVISGSVRIGDETLLAGEILQIEPLESADFEALEDALVLAIKWPSLPGDKEVLD